MKKQINILIIVLSICITQSSFGQIPSYPGVDTLPLNKRDSVLKVIAKNVVMTLGPWYYRDYKIRITDSTWMDDSRRIRPTYVVFYYPDPQIESFSARFAARVTIWKDTGQATDVYFGNSRGLDLEDGWPMWNGKIYQMPFYSKPPIKENTK